MFLNFLFNSSDSNRFVPLLNVYFHVYVVVGLFLQSLLLVLIITKSPSSLADLKLFLYNTTFCQIANILEAYFLQYRALPNSTTLAVLANGPCRKFGPATCFATYHIFVGTCASVSQSIFTTIIFRFSLVKNWRLERKSLIGMILASHVPPVIIMIIPFTATWNFEVVESQSAQEHPSHDLTIYTPFPGFSDINAFAFLFTTGLIATGAYGVPLISIFTIRKILIVTKTHAKMSKNTKHQARVLMKGLACQVVLPFISYFPIITFYLISQFTAEEFLITEHLLNVMTSLPALVDPFISFYFVVPYRVAILRIISTKIMSSTFEIATYLPPAVSNRASGTIQG